MWVTAYLCGFVLHGWFSLDFVLVGILGVVLPRSLTAILLGVATSVDATAAIAETYFLSGHTLVANFFEVRQINLNRVLIIALVIVLQASCVVACLTLPRIPRQRSVRLKMMASLALFALAVVGLQYAEEFSGTGKLPGLGAHLSNKDVVSRAILEHVHLVRSGTRFWFDPQGNYVHLAQRSQEFWKDEGHPGATASVFNLASTAKTGRPDVVVILLESWGLSSDPLIRQSLVSAYSRPEITSHYQVEQGTVPFWGSTDSGEARELCSSISLPPISKGNSPAGLDCLSQKLRSIGYHTTAVHGMSGFMYDRRDLYPRLGFEETWFREQFDAAHLPRCAGAFRGTCDAAIGDWIGNRLAQPLEGPQFIYWVTLGSHLPVPNPPPVKEPAPCNAAPVLEQDIALCAWYQLVFDVHRTVSGLATARVAHPTIFVVVGDHAPPFADPRRRDAFSNSVVPYVVLIPNQLAATHTQSPQAEKNPRAASSSSRSPSQASP